MSVQCLRRRSLEKTARRRDFLTGAFLRRVRFAHGGVLDTCLPPFSHSHPLYSRVSSPPPPLSPLCHSLCRSRRRCDCRCFALLISLYIAHGVAMAGGCSVLLVDQSLSTRSGPLNLHLRDDPAFPRRVPALSRLSVPCPCRPLYPRLRPRLRRPLCMRQWTVLRRCAGESWAQATSQRTSHSVTHTHTHA